MIFVLKITKGHNSIINVDRVVVLNLCTLSEHALHLNLILRKYLNGVQSYWGGGGGHNFHVKICKRA